MSPASRHIVVLTPTDSADEARSIARELVGRRLAACVHVQAPGLSIYRWEGRMVEEQEWTLLIKTTAERFEALRAAIRELHSYDVPEIVALPIVSGDGDYLSWLEESVR